MGIVTGYLCVVCFLLLGFRFVAKRLDKPKLNLFFAKIHRPLSIVFLCLIFIHLVLVFKVLKTRMLIVVISGICMSILAIIMVVISFIQKKINVVFHRFFSAVIVLLIVVHMAVYAVDLKKYRDKIENTNIVGVNASNVKDGEYIGEYDVGYIYAKVKVTVRKSRIEDIEILEHRNERGAKAVQITDEIIRKQRTDVDSISGATNSSKVIKMAVENALR